MRHHGAMNGDGNRRRRWLAQGRRAPGLDDTGPPLASYVGGLRGPVVNASWPLVRLNLFPNGLRLQPNNRMSKSVVPIWEALFDELTEVQAVGRIKWLSTGIRFRAGSQGEWVVFWAHDRPQVLASVQERGVGVNPVPVPFRYLSPGTQP